jgi:hypothetical protein
MICRFTAGMVLLALCVPARPAAAQAQADPVIVNIAGPCLLAVGGRQIRCAGVAYMVFPDTGRIDFTAIIDRTGWAFSGETDHRQEGRYSLEVDSMVSPSANRVEARGQCAMALAEDGRTVRLIQCQASTPAGLITLKASGVASADDGDDDDGDDEDGPGTT